MAIIVVNIERILLFKNKTPRDAIKIQNGKIITVDIGLATFCETLPSK